MNKKQIKRIERIYKGVANHWRIEILLLISKNPKIILDEISKQLNGNYHTIAEHVKKLNQAGLITKNYKGRGIEHSLTPYGQKIIKTFKLFLD